MLHARISGWAKALDQSAAVDCVDHPTLVRRLHHAFGVTRRALDWLRSSYLHARSSFVRWHGFSSSTSLGPLLSRCTLRHCLKDFSRLVFITCMLGLGLGRVMVMLATCSNVSWRSRMTLTLGNHNPNPNLHFGIEQIL